MGKPPGVNGTIYGRPGGPLNQAPPGEGVS